MENQVGPKSKTVIPVAPWQKSINPSMCYLSSSIICKKKCGFTKTMSYQKMYKISYCHIANHVNFELLEFLLKSINSSSPHDLFTLCSYFPLARITTNLVKTQIWQVSFFFASLFMYWEFQCPWHGSIRMVCWNLTRRMSGLQSKFCRYGFDDDYG